MWSWWSMKTHSLQKFSRTHRRPHQRDRISHKTLPNGSWEWHLFRNFLEWDGHGGLYPLQYFVIWWNSSRGRYRGKKQLHTWRKPWQARSHGPSFHERELCLLCAYSKFKALSKFSVLVSHLTDLAINRRKLHTSPNSCVSLSLTFGLLIAYHTNSDSHVSSLTSGLLCYSEL